MAAKIEASIGVISPGLAQATNTGKRWPEMFSEKSVSKNRVQLRGLILVVKHESLGVEACSRGGFIGVPDKRGTFD